MYTYNTHTYICMSDQCISFSHINIYIYIYTILDMPGSLCIVPYRYIMYLLLSNII